MLTSLDIRWAYATVHNLTSIAEFEKYGLMNASDYPECDLQLSLDEFKRKYFIDKVDDNENRDNSTGKRKYSRRTLADSTAEQAGIR